MGFLLRIALLICSVALTACATTPKGPLSLQAQLEHRSTIALPLIENEAGLLLVKADLPDGKGGRFIIDTGATLTSIYPRLQKRLGLMPIEQTAIRVHGMIAARLLPLVEFEGLSLDGRAMSKMNAAIISEIKTSEPTNERFRPPPHDGIIGMDLLSDYHLYIDKPGGELRLIPHDLGPPSLPVDWDVVTLTRNPFLDDGRQLHFFQLRLGNALTPALLDTGSQFNMMNWNTQRFPRLRAVKKKLRKNWEIAGAVGTFEPVTKILSKNARAGQKFWGDNEFLVLDFESLNVLGIDGKPFVIAGMPMFADVPMLIDFQNDQAYFGPDGRSEPRKFITVN